MNGGKVYFIRPIGTNGPTKIGFSALPERRRLALMCYSPFPLEVVLAIDGDRALERRLHSMFADHHSHNEWFIQSDAIDRFIDAFNSIGEAAIDFQSPLRSINPWPVERKAKLSAALKRAWERKSPRSEPPL